MLSHIRVAAVASLVLLARPAGAATLLTLDEAVRTALAANPSLAAAAHDTAAAEAAAQGAKALANPELTITPAITGEGSDEELLAVQRLEVNGSRRARSRIAAGQASGARAATEARRRDLVRDVKVGYYDVVRAQAVVALSRENVALVESLLASARRQVEVGSAPGSQAVKSEVELARARQELARAEADLAQAQAGLNTLMGREVDTVFTVSEALPAPSTALPDAGAALRRPELAQETAALEVRRGEIEAARSLTRPDVTVQARRESFGAAGGLGIGVTLPIFDWGASRAARRQAEASAAAQEKRIEATRSQISLEVARALVAAKGADAEVREYESGVIGRSEQLAQMAEKGYRTGATGYLEVLEAQRTLRTVRTGYYEALAERAKAAAHLEWATAGASLDIEGGK